TLFTLTVLSSFALYFFSFTHPSTTLIYTLSLHDALPIFAHYLLLSSWQLQYVHFYFDLLDPFKKLLNIKSKFNNITVLNYIVFSFKTKLSSLFNFLHGFKFI